MNLSLQFPKDPKNQRNPTLLSLKIASMKGCFDPLLLQWLDYRVTYYKINTPHLIRSDSVQTTTDNTSVDNNTTSRKKTFPSLHESVHSSSDKEKLKMKTDEMMRADSFNEVKCMCNLAMYVRLSFFFRISFVELAGRLSLNVARRR